MFGKKSAGRKKIGKKTLESYLSETAEKKPVPGGGTAAAVAGSIAASLIEMTCAYTLGREAYKEKEAEMTRAKEEANKIRLRLLELAEEDSKAYLAVKEAYKSDDKAKVEEALRHATEVPWETMNLTYKLLSLAETAAEGNTNMLSDVGVAAALSCSALEGAYLNILVNLKVMKSRGYIANTKVEALRVYSAGKWRYAYFSEKLQRKLA